MKRKRIAMLSGALFLFVTFLAFPIYGEYGGHNVNRAIIRFMEENDGRWPAGWSDIEPYHRDPLLSIRSAVIVKRFWDVAWDIDPASFRERRNDHAANLADDEQGIVPVVFRRSHYPDNRVVGKWVLTPQLERHFEATAQTPAR